MSKTSFQELLDAGVHFGHLKRKWNPNMAPYIFMERNGIHIIDLQKTADKLEDAAAALRQIAKSGRKILFVATKKQAKDIVAERVNKVNMPYVTERWPGGMLTNFPTIRKAVKKMAAIDNMATDGTFSTLSKRERLQMVDTNSDPNQVEFPIPANDDASKSISLVVNVICESIEEGLNERKMEREKEAANKEQAEKEAAMEAELEEASKEEPAIALDEEELEDIIKVKDGGPKKVAPKPAGDEE
jgi:small subunit ribosomal protein S2